MFLFGRVYLQFTLKDKLVSCHVQGGFLVTMTELARGSKRTEHETSVGEVERCIPRLLASNRNGLNLNRTPYLFCC